MKMILGVFLLLSFSFADIMFLSEEIKGGQKTGEHVIYVANGAIRADDMEGKVLKHTVIFNYPEGKIYLIDHAKRQYTVITKEYIKSAEKYMEEMKRRMQEQLAQLPPEQREAMKGMMDSRMRELMNPPRVEYKLLEKGAKLNGWKCDLYEELVNGERVSRLCVVPFGKLGIEGEVVNLIKSFDEFLGSVASEKVSRAFDKGLPVVEIYYEGGKEVSRTVLKKVQKGALKHGIFNLPAGYKEQKLQIPNG